jgi:hypothetical protein
MFPESLLTPIDDLFDSDGHVNRLGASRTSGDRGRSERRTLGQNESVV